MSGYMHSGWTQEEYEARVAAFAVLTIGVEGHAYLSTACLHGEHGYCQGKEGLAGTKVPAQCKFCAAPCICACHEEDYAVQVAGAASEAVRHQPEGSQGVRGGDPEGQEAA